MDKTFAFISDIHFDEQNPIDHGVDARKNWDIILQDLALRDFDDILFGGDIGNPTSYVHLFKSLNKLISKPKIILGNHDDYKEVNNYYSNPHSAGFDELYYSCNDDQYKYLFLDSSSHEISPAQLEWIQKELATEKQVIIFVHHPILAVQTPVDRDAPLRNRDQIKEILANHEGRITLFCGHYHMEDERRDGNIVQYITPASSFQFVKEAEKLEWDTDVFGYRLINFTDEGIKTEVIWFKNKSQKVQTEAGETLT